jgi:sulfur-oxidizing protein SoxA
MKRAARMRPSPDAAVVRADHQPPAAAARRRGLNCQVEKTMKRQVNWLFAGIALLVFSASAIASPESDLREFQGYFKKAFPKVPFDDYSNGVYALDETARGEWEQIMAFPPYEIELEQGKKIWGKKFANGKTLASCFRNNGVKVAQNYPYWDEARKEVRTIELDINDCLTRNGEEPIKDLEKGPMAQVVAYMKSLSAGERIQLDLSSPGAQAAYEAGKKFYWSRRGQLNFACGHCHVGNAGKFIRGDSLSAGLGHGTGFPVYRGKDGQILTLHQRYKGCNSQVRAKPFEAQSTEYRNLEFYETYMNTGLPLTAPSYRR